ncbi:hypothetical protein ABZ412_27830 [Nocardia sp. NPDC005746]|uniref:hypothetical protein n=1 Tax=Nocardia sp. NPDC005746 TaxID=3157062 RepID=UPI0033E8D344
MNHPLPGHISNFVGFSAITTGTPLSSDYHERGTAARRRAAELLADVDVRLDAVLAQMDEWLARTDALINDAIGDPTP